MKLDTDNYKLTIYSEDVCPDCQELKRLLSEERIPYINKCITISRTLKESYDKENSANRWEFHDLAEEYPTKVAFSPLIVVENSEGKIEELYSSGQHEGGFESAEDAIKILKENYCV
tara:strand:- start:437 stop:787 length:351 start_codon:yes stop_codon:yes gene_type:complete